MRYRLYAFTCRLRSDDRCSDMTQANTLVTVRGVLFYKAQKKEEKGRQLLFRDVESICERGNAEQLLLQFLYVTSVQ